MFIRKYTKTDRITGKKYFFYVLAESIRTKKGPRQKILLNLGANLEIEPEETKLLANRIEELTHGINCLITYPDHIETLAKRFANALIKKKSEVFQPSNTSKVQEKSPTDYQEVDINSIKHIQARTVGVETIAYEAFKELGIETKLEELGFSKRQIQVAAAVIIGRLAGPGNELATYHWLKNESGLDEVMRTSFQKLALRKVYEIGDLLFAKKCPVLRCFS